MIRLSLQKSRGEFSVDVTFDAPSPAVVALFGASGCGKTTVVNLIAGLLRPDAGRVEIGGEVLLDTARGIDVPAERRRLGYVFQDARLFPHLDVRRNLEYGSRRSRGSSGSRMGFGEVIALLGLESLLARRPSGLSGGERQRVALGRALLSRPRLLLLDEPLAALDAARREEVLPYLERVRDEWRIPMFYVTHQFEEMVRMATDVILMDRGRVAASGSLAAVMLDPAMADVAGDSGPSAVIDAGVAGHDPATGLCRIPAGDGELRIIADHLVPHSRVRVQVNARDVILATHPAEGLSVRNSLAGHVTAVRPAGHHAVLVSIDIGSGTTLVSRITEAARRDLNVVPGMRVWALVKAVSVRSVGPAGS